MNQDHTRPAEPDTLQQRLAEVHLTEVRSLLSLQKLVEDLVHEQGAGDEEGVDSELEQQYRRELRQKLRLMPAREVAYIIESLDAAERLVVWEEVKEGADAILALLPDDVLEELIDDSHYRNEKMAITAFELCDGRLRQIPVNGPEDLANIKPIWVDLIAPTKKVRGWMGQMFDIDVPDPGNLTDLEASARFYVDDEGHTHLHSDFLLDTREESRNVPVAMILHEQVLFTVRSEELPVFRLQRARARTRPGYVSNGTDVLIDLYAADVEYSASALEDSTANSIASAGRCCARIPATRKRRESWWRSRKPRTSMPAPAAASSTPAVACRSCCAASSWPKRSMPMCARSCATSNRSTATRPFSSTRSTS